jgi:hypothetical protein
MNNRIESPFVIAIASISIIISLLFGYMTTTPYMEVSGQSPSKIHITKELANSYTISSGSSQIGTFDANYTVSGDMDMIKKEQKLIVSTITNDFNNSPVIGYVKMPPAPSQQQQQQTTLPNPFADNATINNKIETEINSALSPAGDSTTAKTSIQCNFGMNIAEWNCKSTN